MTEPEGSLPRSQEPVTSLSISRQIRSTPSQSVCFKICFNIILPSASRSSKWPVSFVSPPKPRIHIPTSLYLPYAPSIPSSLIFIILIMFDGRSQLPRGLRCRSAAVRLLRLWVRNPPGYGCVCCECCVLSGRGLCDKLITRPEESYRLWCVVVCDLTTSLMRRPWPPLGRSPNRKKNVCEE